LFNHAAPVGLSRTRWVMRSRPTGISLFSRTVARMRFMPLLPLLHAP
jgi:hypothetical protein